MGCELSISSEDPVNFLENGFEKTLFPLGLNMVSYQENKNYKQIPLHHHLVISFVMFYKIMPGFHKVGHL